MEISQIFNKKRFFLRFNGLRYHFLQNPELNLKKVDAVYDYQKFNSLATEIMFFAKNAYRILEQMKNLDDASVLQFNEIKSSLCLKCKRFVFQSSIVDEYLSLLMPFLNTMYVLQDRIMSVIAKASNISVKPRDIKENETNKDYKKYKYKFKKSLNSFHSFATDEEYLFSRFSPEIQGIVKEYWKSNGKLIRRYRNIEQLIFNLVIHSYLQISPKEKLLIILPDNPRAQPQDYRYNNRNAYDFFKLAFRNFNFFVEKMAKALKFEEQMHVLEGTDLWRIKLEKVPDYSTISVVISDNVGFEICKELGFPTKLTQKTIKIDKKIQITRTY